MQQAMRWTLALLGLALVAVTALAVDLAAGVLLAFPAAAATRDLGTILKEMKELQEKYKGKPMPADVGTRFEELGAEAKALQDEAERARRIKEVERFAGEPVRKTMPEDQKQGGRGGKPMLLTPGEAYVNSAAYKRFRDAGFPRTPIGGAMTFDTIKQGRAVAITPQMLESKAVDASGIIRPDWDPGTMFEEERERRTFLRDLVDTRNTNGEIVFFPIFAPYEDAAAGVLPGGMKPEANVVIGDGSAPVRDLAVTTPIKEQTLQDAPQIQSIIDGKLRRDLDRTEEREMLWGDGSTFLGIFQTPGVGAMTRTPPPEAGDATLLDRIRMAITDIELAEGEPNGIAADPLDAERLHLLKGTDGHYVYVVVTNPVNGQLRVWGLQIVRTTAVRQPGTAERRLLVGDFNGAVLWDRRQTTAAIGWVNDQFRRNERTIRLEKRAAFGVPEPYLFRYLVTQPAA